MWSGMVSLRGEFVGAVVHAREQVAECGLVESGVGTDDVLGTTHGLGFGDVALEFYAMRFVGGADLDDGSHGVLSVVGGLQCSGLVMFLCSDWLDLLCSPFSPTRL